MKATLRTALLAIGMTALISAPALADDEEQRETSYDFDGDTIDGDMMRPGGDFIDTRDFAQHTSLIRVRAEFTAEIIQTAEEL